MRILLSCLLLLATGLTSVLASAASPSPPPKRFPVYADGRQGFIDARGKLVIPHRFEGTTGFEEGLARVKIAGK